MSSINIDRQAMKKILVISDNVNLCNFLIKLQAEIDLHSLCFLDFCYTSYNQNPQPLIEIGAQKINVKQKGVIDWIVRDYDIVFSLHCKQIFPKALVSKIPCFNFHPGFNPYNRGWYPQAFSIINDLPIGATIHRMDEQVDHGGIVAQKKVHVFPNDTSMEVYNRVIDVEKELIKENIINIITNKSLLSTPNKEGNYNSIKDYKDLCKLDLNSIGTLESHINLLRALSHGEFQNAYYIKNGKKYFIKIEIDAEDQ